MVPKAGRTTLLLCLLIALIVFLADLFIPLGIAISVLYMAVILLMIRLENPRYIGISGIVITLLIVAGFFFSPSGSLVAGAINRVLVLLILWVGTAYIWAYLRERAQYERNSGKLDALFESASEGIIITNKSGAIELINPSAERLFGYLPNELVGKKIEILIPRRFTSHHVEYRDDFMENPRARAMGHGRDLYAMRNDGTEFPVEVSLSYFKMGQEQYAISFVIDITDRKKAEFALRKAKADVEKYAEVLRQSNHELEQFAYVASHDLQEPLRKIMAFGDRLKSKEYDILSVNGKDYLDRMLNAAGRMRGLINDLLTFSRVTTQAKPFVKVNLETILQEVLTDLEIAIERSGATVETSPLPIIEADPLQMRQLLQNLISNALKFTREGVRPLVKVHSESFEDRNPKGDNCQFIRILVEDNGIGFDEKYLDRIFNIFQRLEGRNFEGSGVGLAICKKIAIRHGGDVTAKSKPGEGSTFIVTLACSQ